MGRANTFMQHIRLRKYLRWAIIDSNQRFGPSVASNAQIEGERVWLSTGFLSSWIWKDKKTALRFKIFIPKRLHILDPLRF